MVKMLEDKFLEDVFEEESPFATQAMERLLSGQQRRCTELGCTTPLSALNQDDERCFRHRNPVIPRHLTYVDAEPQQGFLQPLIPAFGKPKLVEKRPVRKRRGASNKDAQLPLLSVKKGEKLTTGNQSVDKLVEEVALAFGTTAVVVLAGNRRASTLKTEIADVRGLLVHILNQCMHITDVMRLLGIKNQGNACTLRARGMKLIETDPRAKAITNRQKR